MRYGPYTRMLPGMQGVKTVPASEEQSRAPHRRPLQFHPESGRTAIPENLPPPVRFRPIPESPVPTRPSLQGPAPRSRSLPNTSQRPDRSCLPWSPRPHSPEWKSSIRSFPLLQVFLHLLLHRSPSGHLSGTLSAPPAPHRRQNPLLPCPVPQMRLLPASLQYIPLRPLRIHRTQFQTDDTHPQTDRRLPSPSPQYLRSPWKYSIPET